jgi:(2Fe-2S) ferredoxin
MSPLAPEASDSTARRYVIMVCRGPTCGKKRNAQALYDALRALIDVHGLAGRVELGWKVCFGRCTRGPNALVRECDPGAPEGNAGFGLSLALEGGASAFYTGLTPSDASALIGEHVLGGAIVKRLIDGPARREERPGAAAPRAATTPPSADDP